MSELHHFEIDGRRVAYRLRGGVLPTLVFLPGYASDMEGAKALALDAFAGTHGLTMLRLDYSGTGSSGGRFEDGTLATWIEDALAAIDRLTEGPVILIGSSMGGLDRASPRPSPARARTCARWNSRRARLHRLGLSRTSERAAGRGRDSAAGKPVWRRASYHRRLLVFGTEAAAPRQRSRDRLPGPAGPRRSRPRRAPGGCRPDHGGAAFSRCPASGTQRRGSPPVGTARDRRHPAHRRRTLGA